MLQVSPIWHASSFMFTWSCLTHLRKELKVKRSSAWWMTFCLSHTAVFMQKKVLRLTWARRVERLESTGKMQLMLSKPVLSTFALWFSKKGPANHVTRFPYILKLFKNSLKTFYIYVIKENVWLWVMTQNRSMVFCVSQTHSQPTSSRQHKQSWDRTETLSAALNSVQSHPILLESCNKQEV